MGAETTWNALISLYIGKQSLRCLFSSPSCLSFCMQMLKIKHVGYELEEVKSPSQTEIYPKASLLVLPTLGKLIPANSRGFAWPTGAPAGSTKPNGPCPWFTLCAKAKPSRRPWKGFSDSGPSAKAEIFSTAALRQWRDEDLREATVRHKKSVCRYREVFCLPLPTVCGVTQSHAHTHEFHVMDFVENRLKNAFPILFPFIWYVTNSHIPKYTARYL